MIRKCKCCHEDFDANDARQKFCCPECCQAYRAQKLRGVADADIKPPRKIRARNEAAFMRRARLAKRDQYFARSPYAPRVTIEERGGRVIETRGQCCAGWRPCGHVSHNG